MDVTTIIEIIIPAVTAFGGWLAGRYNRKKEAISAMQKSVDDLIAKNAEYINTIRDLNARVLELEQTNAKLVVGQEELKLQIKVLTDENSELMKKIGKTKETKKKDENK